MELNNTIDCIFDIEDKYIVLIKRDHEPFKDFWALPGGRQLVGEALDQTVVREMQEETGLDRILQEMLKILLMTSYPQGLSNIFSLMEKIWTNILKQKQIKTLG